MMKGYIKSKTNLVGRITQPIQNQVTKSVYTYEYPSYVATELESKIYTYEIKESESE